MIYIIKVAIVLSVFYLFNRVLLSRDTFHKLNRVLWLLVIPISMILPFIDINYFAEPLGGVIVFENEIFEAKVSQEELAQTSNFLQNTILGLCIIYIIGVIITLVVKVGSLIEIRKIIISSTAINSLPLGQVQSLTNDVGARILVHPRKIAPFSFFNYIIISQIDLNESHHEILIHELMHIKMKHSYDILLLDLLTTLLWFTPASWLLKSALQQVHEYSVDEKVIEAGIEPKSYQLLLIKKAVGHRMFSMANSLNHSNLKKRITMMLKEKSNRWAYLKCLYAIPLTFVAIVAYSSPKISNIESDISEIKINEKILINERVETTTPSTEQTKPITYAEVDVKPSFQGSDVNAFSMWIAQNMKYPEKALKEKTQGRVLLSFVVNIKGEVENVKLIKGVEESLNDEAVRVVSSSPRWEPGKHQGKAVAVEYTFPIVFQLR